MESYEEEDYEGDEWDTYVPKTTLQLLIEELEWNLNVVDRYVTCPICFTKMICLEDNGAAQRFICQNAHLFSTNEQLLNN